MDQRRLIVFTNSFPTDTNETFFANELPYLARAFREVHLVPTEKTGNKVNADLPENVVVHLENFSLRRIGKVTALFSVFRKSVFQEIKIALRRRSAESLKIRIATVLISWKKAGLIADRAEALFRSDGSDIFYAYWADNSAIGLARLKEKCSNVTCITRAHRWDIFHDEPSGNCLPFRSFIAEMLDFLHPISQTGADYIRDHWPARQDKVVVSRLGISNPLKKLNPGSSFSDQRIIVSISSLVALKRLPFLIEVLSNVQNIKVKWVHFGGGPQLEDLAALAEVKLKNTVEFEFKGRVPNEQILQWLENNHVDALINLSSIEGIPVSVMEAYSRGIPAIATSVGGTPEIVSEANGLLININAPAVEVAKQVEDFLSSGDLSLKRKAAFQTWNENFNADVNYPDFVEKLKR